jgi:hypothetical protein
VLESPTLPESIKQQVVTTAEKSANFVSTSQVESACVEAGLPPEQTKEIVTVYSAAQLEALRAGLAFLALFALLALAWVRRLPDRSGPSKEPQTA